MKKEYDLIFSIGGACITSYHLRRLYLQKLSLPFDWLINYSGLKVIECFENDFNDFFDKNYLKFAGKMENSIKYKNTKYQIEFIHDLKFDFESEYPNIYDKYKRRCTRLLDYIKNSNDILIVYYSETECSKKELISFINRFNKKFHKNINILNIVEDTNYKKPKLIMECENYRIVKFSNEIANRTWIGNTKNWEEVLSKYSLKGEKNVLFARLKRLINFYCIITF